MITSVPNFPCLVETIYLLSTTRENQKKIPTGNLLLFIDTDIVLTNVIVLETPCPICYFRILKGVSLLSNKFVRSPSCYYWLYEIAKYVSVLSSSIIMITQICVKISHTFQRLKRRSQQNHTLKTDTCWQTEWRSQTQITSL